KSPSKKAKKEVKPVDREKSVNLKKLIDELLSNYIYPQIGEVVEESGGLYKQYKEYKKDNGKEASNALVFDDVRKQISKVSDTALRKRIERARKIYKLFTAIVNGDEKIAKQKIVLIRSFSLYSISNLSQSNINFIIVKCLRNKDMK
ncbi:3749_t:CDS:2, partial [Diversispora eburnea]